MITPHRGLLYVRLPGEKLFIVNCPLYLRSVLSCPKLGTARASITPVDARCQPCATFAAGNLRTVLCVVRGEIEISFGLLRI
jgi:hypothetical protein